MDLAVLGMKKLKRDGILDNMEESDEINACSIVVPVEFEDKTEEWLISFKNETHNHPTEIEPFGGAATCLGGAIRDPLSGRSSPLIRRITVDFPEPDGPSRPKTPPSGTVNENPESRAFPCVSMIDKSKALTASIFLTSLPPRQSIFCYRKFSDQRERSAVYVQA